MIIEELEFALKNDKIEQALDIVEKIGEEKVEKAVPILINILLETENNLLRNAVAIALADIGNSSAVEPIIDMLKHPKTLGYRGTLLFALESFECSEYIEVLTEFLCTGNFEVRWQSYLLIERMKKKINKNVKRKCQKIIISEIREIKEKMDYLYDALNMLDKK